LPIADHANAGPDYLALLRLPLLTGRPFTEADLEITEKAAENPKGGDGVCIVNRAFTLAFFKNEDPIGQRLLEGDKLHGCRIVGVVADYRPMGAENGPRPQIFRPDLGNRRGSLVVRTAAPADVVAGGIRKIVYGLDRGLTIDTIRPLDYWVDEWQSQRKFNTLLLSVFAGLALLLALAGIYSVLSNVVTSRVREIGIRVAIGARPLQIGKLVLFQSMIPVAGGLAIGLAASFALGRYLEILLFQVRARDPLTLALSAFAILAVSPAAVYFPVRRALAVDCTVALREE
jgi:putative ABC transport system permease protein